MPEIVVTPLPKSEVKLEFVVSAEEARPYLEEAIKELSTSRPVPGFRPGKLPFADGMRLYGPMVVLETALERIVRSTYVRAVVDKQLDWRGVVPGLQAGLNGTGGNAARRLVAIGAEDDVFGLAVRAQQTIVDRHELESLVLGEAAKRHGWSFLPVAKTRANRGAAEHRPSAGPAGNPIADVYRAPALCEAVLPINIERR